MSARGTLQRHRTGTCRIRSGCPARERGRCPDAKRLCRSARSGTGVHVTAGPGVKPTRNTGRLDNWMTDAVGSELPFAAICTSGPSADKTDLGYRHRNVRVQGDKTFIHARYQLTFRTILPVYPLLPKAVCAALMSFSSKTSATKGLISDRSIRPTRLPKTSGSKTVQPKKLRSLR